jgi:hypothetical protein
MLLGEIVALFCGCRFSASLHRRGCSDGSLGQNEAGLWQGFGSDVEQEVHSHQNIASY